MTKSSRFKNIPAELYDGWYETPSGNWTGTVELGLVLDALKPAEGDSILDIGCGTGWFTRQLGKLTGICLTGVDIDTNWLAYAQSRDSASRYCQADALSLPFEDKRFSHVLSITALCFTPDWKRAIAEAVRVAEKRIAIGLLNRNSLLWWKKAANRGVLLTGQSGSPRLNSWKWQACYRLKISGFPPRFISRRDQDWRRSLSVC